MSVGFDERTAPAGVPLDAMPRLERFPSTALVDAAVGARTEAYVLPSVRATVRERRVWDRRYEGVERRITVTYLPTEVVDGVVRVAASFLEGAAAAGVDLEGAGHYRADRLRVEGPVWRIEVAPGVVQVASRDPLRRDRALERGRDDAQEAARIKAVLRLAACRAANCGCGGGERDCAGDWHERDGVSRLHSWSAKSRARMIKKLLRLDVGPMFASGGTPALITLTLPGDWLAVCPSPKVWAGFIAKFRRRFAKRWGRQPVGFWKREFQRRGAPHWHFMGWVPDDPGFRRWLSETWAEIVAADHCGTRCWESSEGACCELGRHVLAGAGVDYYEGERASDPKRMAVYFAKHGSFADKDYQNDAPREWVHDAGCDDDACGGCSATGVGRFWGVWGLEDAARASQIPPDVADAMMRIMRRWARTKRFYVAGEVWRKKHRVEVDTTTGEVTDRWRWRKRKSLRPVIRLAGGQRAGWLAVNDGPSLAVQLQRAAEQAVMPHRSRSGPVGLLPPPAYDSDGFLIR